MLLFNTILSSIIQILIFSLVPIIFYLAREKRIQGFFRYLGFFKPSSFGFQMGIMSAPLLVIIGFGAALWPDFREILISPGTVAGDFREYSPGIILVLSIFFTAVFKTALAEEVFFRGFLARELINRFGFANGNAIQAFIFGMVHVILFQYTQVLPEIPTLLTAAIFLGSTLAGYIMGYLQMLAGGGSIIPNWIAHGLTNLTAFLILVFYF